MHVFQRLNFILVSGAQTYGYIKKGLLEGVKRKEKFVLY